MSLGTSWMCQPCLPQGQTELQETSNIVTRLIKTNLFPTIIQYCMPSSTVSQTRSNGTIDVANSALKQQNTPRETEQSNCARNGMRCTVADEKTVLPNEESDRDILVNTWTNGVASLETTNKERIYPTQGVVIKQTIKYRYIFNTPIKPVPFLWHAHVSNASTKDPNHAVRGYSPNWSCCQWLMKGRD